MSPIWVSLETTSLYDLIRIPRTKMSDYIIALKLEESGLNCDKNSDTDLNFYTTKYVKMKNIKTVIKGTTSCHSR